jgi:spore coat protein U-like protein
MKLRLLSSLLLLPLPAWAAQCTVSATPVAFGAYDPFATTPLDGVGGVQVRCDVSVAYSVALGAGNGTVADRRLVSGPSFLRYGLFTDAARAVPWGDGTGGTNLLSGQAMQADHVVYGRVLPAQNAPVGQYADTLVVTLTF